MFYLFGGDDWIARGGMDDFQGAFQSVDEAFENASRNEFEWWHIVDMSSLKIVVSRCEVNWTKEIQERIDGIANKQDIPILTESDVRRIVVDTLRELVSGTVENNPEQDADGDEWNNYVFDGVAFVERILKSANE